MIHGFQPGTESDGGKESTNQAGSNQKHRIKSDGGIIICTQILIPIDSGQIPADGNSRIEDTCAISELLYYPKNCSFAWRATNTCQCRWWKPSLIGGLKIPAQFPHYCISTPIELFIRMEGNKHMSLPTVEAVIDESMTASIIGIDMRLSGH